MNTAIIKNIILFAGFLFCAVSTGAYPAVEGCPVLTDADFASEVIVGRDVDPEMGELLRSAIDIDENGMADIFYIERGNTGKDSPGKVKLFRESTGQVSTLASMPSTVSSSFEDGLTGIVLDPDFKNNGWIYLFHNYSTHSYDDLGDGRAWNDLDGVFRVNRYTFDGTTLDLGTEVLIIEIPVFMSRFHTAGDLEIDAHGDLWISIGDNTRDGLGGVDAHAEGTSACLNDLKGAILRITPLPEGGYTIPVGNFADHFAGDFPEYSDESKVKPELFAKGLRNGYSFTVHPTRQWVGWGDCGPDGGIVGEEHNLAVEPGFFGFPYFLNQNESRMGKEAEAPVNSSSLCSGAQNLPPAIPASYNYGKSCAMGGALYVYDTTIDNSRQLPPQMNNLWFMGDFSNDNLHTKKISSDGVPESGMENNTFENIFSPSGMTDMEVGPDGAIYVSSYGHGYFNANQDASIQRLTYVGERNFSAECLTNAGVESLVVPTQFRNKNSHSEILLEGQTLHIKKPGVHHIKIFSLDGTRVNSLTGSGINSYPVKTLVPEGIHFFEIKGDNFKRKYTRKIVNM